MRKCVGLSGGILLLFLTIAGSLSSCGGGGTGDAPLPRTPQFVLDPVGTASNAGTLIMGVTRSSIDANNADRLDIFAQVLDPQRRPIGGLPIEFEASFQDVRFLGTSTEPGPGEFPRGVQFTDGSGTATITIQAGGTPGRLTVSAATPRNFNLGGVIFFQLTDVGFISGELQVLPAEIKLTDPPLGTDLVFQVIGGTPFVDRPASVDLAEIEQTAPYRIQNASSPIGDAALVFDGQFPAEILYEISGKAGGEHVFTVTDAVGGNSTGTVSVEVTLLELSPASASLFVGESQVFAITGGIPPYSCSASGGTVTPNIIEERGGTFTFTAGEVISDSTFTIVCSDQTGQVVTGDVNLTPLPSPSGGDGGGPTPLPPEASRLALGANPPTLNATEGGLSTVTATVFDQSLQPLAGVGVIFSLPDPTGDPPAQLPSLSPLTGVSDANGQVATVVTVPKGMAPQFLTISADTDTGIMGSVDIAITSQRVDAGGEPDRISAALIKEGACGDNNDGTFFAVLSALVIDPLGNPVSDGLEVVWDEATPEGRTNVLTPSLTNTQPPCDVTPYSDPCGGGGSNLTLTPQPGTAITCFIYDADAGGLAARVRATVAGTDISVATSFILPEPPAPPVAPTPAPSATPAPTPTPDPPTVAPASANLDVGQSQVFAISGGVAPYTVSPSGGTAMPTTVPSSGGTFTYTASLVGNFTILISDSNGQVAQATVTNAAAAAIQVDKPGPIIVSQGAAEVITITSGGVPPYTVTLAGGLAGSIGGSPLAGPGSFTYTAPVAGSGGQILITDSAAGTPNTLSISVTVP